MLEYFDKYSESSYSYRDKRCWPLLLKTSKNMIFKTLNEVLPEHQFTNISYNNDYWEFFGIHNDCEITISLVNNGSNIQLNLSIFCDRMGKTFKELKLVNELLSNIFEGFIIN